MRVGDDDQRINCEWPNQFGLHENVPYLCFIQIFTIFKYKSSGNLKNSLCLLWHLF